jgi:hypothetical protein
MVEDAPEGGLIARSADGTIVTEAEEMDGLLAAVGDAIRCRFEEEDLPPLIRLHYVCSRSGNRSVRAGVSAGIRTGVGRGGGRAFKGAPRGSRGVLTK